MTIGNNVEASTTSPITLANVDAYQFGLGPVSPGELAATINLNPIVYQAGSDFMLIIGSSAVQSGFYLKAKVPIAVYEITYQLTENRPVTPVVYAAGALSIDSSSVTDPATSMSEAFTGFKNEQLSGVGDYIPMYFGLINTVSTTEIRIGDVELTAGYNFILHGDDSWTLAVRVSAPSGNKAEGTYMLEPIVGRGGNYGLGAYAAGHFHLWQGADDSDLTFKFMGDAMHLFTTNTMRSYDLTSAGPGSRYLLVANYLGGSYQEGPGGIQNLINYTTLSSDSSFGVEADIAIALNYTCWRGWSFDLGYELYGRSAETLAITGDFADQTYAILGRQGVGQIVSGSIESYGCQPSATINSSVDRQDFPGATNPLIVDARIASNRISFSDLDIPAAAQAAYITSKLFTKISYEWKDIDYLPFFGVIGEIEMSNCLNNALPQWSVAVVGGASF